MNLDNNMDSNMSYTTLKDLAVEFGMDRSNMRKYVLKNGVMPVTIRDKQTRQEVLALSEEDADAMRALRARQGFAATFVAPLENGNGLFYVIQLVPDLDPLRVKLGWTGDMQGRLASHRTAAPTLELVKMWPCRKVWEIAAIDSITRIECTLILNEVYRCEDLARLAERCDQFFALMPG